MSRWCVLISIAALVPLAGCDVMTGLDASDGSSVSAFTTTQGAAAGRAGHVAVSLPDGRVLVAGGASGITRLASAEIFDPASRTWSAAPSMSFARLGHAGVALADGRVLVVGGHAAEQSCTENGRASEIYDPASGNWARVADMVIARNSPSAVLLNDGRVLVAGGGNRCGDVSRYAEIYDPRTGVWSMTTSMNVHRQAAAAVRLADGRVLVAGGVGDQRTSFGSLGSAEIYNPATQTWTLTGAMNARRLWGSVDVSAAGALALLPDGRVLAAGGYDSCWQVCGLVLHSSAEVFDPATGGWSRVGSMGRARSHHRLSVLQSGHVLVAGGQANGATLSEAEIFDPAGGSFVGVGHLDSGRYDYTATWLGGQRVLLAQGQGATGPLASAEIFAANGAPLADAGPAVQGDEGAELAFSAERSSDPDGDVLSYMWTFGDGSPAVSGMRVAHRYADDGDYVVTLVVSDGEFTATAVTSAAVANVAPAVSGLSGAMLLAGERYSASGSFEDPGADAWSATVDYGDGSGAQALVLSGKSFSLSRVYASAGVYPVQVVVRDDDGGEGVARAEVAVMTSQQGIQEWLLSPIAQWAQSGSLNRGNANALAAKLEAAMQQLDRGNIEAALNQLGAFVNQVQALVRSGRLSVAQGYQLIAAVQRIMDAVAVM